MQLLREAISNGQIELDLAGHDLDEILQHSLQRLVEMGRLDAEHLQEVQTALLEREHQVSTAIGHAVAVPHVYMECIDSPTIFVVRLSRPLNLGAPDGVPTRFLFLLMGPRDSATVHLDTLTAIARLMSDEEFRYEFGQARTNEELLEALKHFEDRTSPAAAALPPSEEGLEFTGRFAGGIIDDLRRRLPHYVSDFTDGLTMKTVSSTLFLFFACIAPTVTFGGIMAEVTGNSIGPVEMMIAACLYGVLYGLFSGTPMVILGGTGPLLVFTMVLYQLSQDLQLPFLPLYAWVGLWTGLFTVLMAVFDASALMRFFTRFTIEIFAALISMIYIYESLRGMFSGAIEAHSRDEVNHEDAIIPLMLAFGTYYIAMSLTRFRRSRYLMQPIREFLADFGPAIALGLMTLFAIWLHSVEEFQLPQLPAPSTVQPTQLTEDGTPRPWLIDAFALPTWAWAASMLPALLGAVLIYLDQNITVRLVNSADHKLRKGPAYHWDLALIGAMIGIFSLFGLPWFVAATVRSLNHVRSLATYEEHIDSSGEGKEQIIHMQETRLTGVFIHLLIGCSLLLLPLLREIPMAVLYGLFLFMGVASITGNQFFERLNLWLMDSNLYPRTHYIRKVSPWIVHLYTLVQVVCLAVLWIVKVSPFGILFPLFIALLVPVRFWITRLFTPEQLAALDADEEPTEEQNAWV